MGWGTGSEMRAGNGAARPVLTAKGLVRLLLVVCGCAWMGGRAQASGAGATMRDPHLKGEMWGTRSAGGTRVDGALGLVGMLPPFGRQKDGGPGLSVAPHLKGEMWGTRSAGGTRVGLGPLRKVGEIRRLTPREAASSLPVRLTGVVTALSGYKDSLFFADDTAGIDVEGAKTPVQPGDLVELTGVTGGGFFAPIVAASEVRVLGHAARPQPRAVALADLLGGAQDSQWIEVTGTIHSAQQAVVYRRPVLTLSLDLGGQSMRVLLQDFTSADEKRLVDATVRLRGVCISDFNEKRQFVGLGLIVSGREDVEVLQAAPADPFALPTTPIRDALRFGQAQHRVKVAGVATYQLPGHYLYLQEGSDGIRVQSPAKEAVTPGSLVEAVGFPVSGDYAPVLSDGLFRVKGAAAPVQPVTIQAGVVITRPGEGEFTHVDYGDQLVRIEGEVVESRIQGDQQVWILREAGSDFEAYLPVFAANAKTAGLGPGSVLRLTGICTVQADFDRNPVSFGILLRSPEDIEVLRRMSWWSPRHLLALLASLGAVALAGSLWLALLRLRVMQLTRSVLANEQRLRYLATHDGLTGLPNRNSILATLEESLAAARGRGATVSVAIADLDHFKRINDTYGHPAGDEVLREAAKRLAAAVRDTDAVGRYGGEEFLIVFQTLDQGIGFVRCEELRDAIRGEPILLGGDQRLQISCSIGIASCRDGSIKAEQLIAEADRALYEAKAAGRNRVVSFRREAPAAEPEPREAHVDLNPLPV